MRTILSTQGPNFNCLAQKSDTILKISFQNRFIEPAITVRWRKANYKLQWKRFSHRKLVLACLTVTNRNTLTFSFLFLHSKHDVKPRHKSPFLSFNYRPLQKQTLLFHFRVQTCSVFVVILEWLLFAAIDNDTTFSVSGSSKSCRSVGKGLRFEAGYRSDFVH